MKMVAAARLRRAQERASASRPYTEKIQEVLASVTASVRDAEHPLLVVREVKKTGYLVIGADKGLAGAYTSNLMKEAVAQVRGKDNVELITVGRKPRDYFRRRSYNVIGEYSGFSEKPEYHHAVTLAADVANRFAAGELDEVHLVYTRFISPINQKPTTLKLLPVADSQAADGDVQGEYIFEPSAAEVLNQLLPKYLETVIYGALLQAAASELGSRMTAMGSATDNAQELIAKLVLNYNKVRQATITRELSEIVGGAEALK
jgi:F-type H+-transporting ATPase subunit gamma